MEAIAIQGKDPITDWIIGRMRKEYCALEFSYMQLQLEESWYLKASFEVFAAGAPFVKIAAGGLA